MKNIGRSTIIAFVAVLSWIGIKPFENSRSALASIYEALRGNSWTILGVFNVFLFVGTLVFYVFGQVPGPPIMLIALYLAISSLIILIKKLSSITAWAGGNKKKFLAIVASLLTLSSGGAIYSGDGGDFIVGSPVTITSPLPNDGATETAFDPSLSVTITDGDGSLDELKFKTNATGGVWITLDTQTDIANGTVTYLPSNIFDESNTKYWWSVNTSDGGSYSNATYSFTTSESGVTSEVNDISPFAYTGDYGDTLTVTSTTEGNPDSVTLYYNFTENVSTTTDEDFVNALGFSTGDAHGDAYDYDGCDSDSEYHTAWYDDGEGLYVHDITWRYKWSCYDDNNNHRMRLYLTYNGSGSRTQVDGVTQTSSSGGWTSRTYTVNTWVDKIETYAYAYGCDDYSMHAHSWADVSDITFTHNQKGPHTGTWVEYQTDSSAPFEYDFNFPNGTGYYQFYTIAEKDGVYEQAPSTYDTDMDKYGTNFVPVYPDDDAEVETPSPTCQMYLNHDDNNDLTVKWYTSTDGSSWTLQQTDTDVNDEIVSYDYTSATDDDATYYWRVNVDDGVHINDEREYSFTINNPITIDSFNIDSESQCGENWDNDNDDVQIDWSYTDEDGDNCDLYFTFAFGEASRTPTQYDYDARILSSDSSGTDYELPILSTGWVDTSDYVHMSMVAWDGEVYSTVVSDSLSGGIDDTPPLSNVDTFATYNTFGNFIINATANDATSGVKKVELYYRFSSDNATWSDYTLYDYDVSEPYQWTFDFPSGNGFYEFKTSAIDNALNEEKILNFDTNEERVIGISEYNGQHGRLYRQDEGWSSLHDSTSAEIEDHDTFHALYYNNNDDLYRGYTFFDTSILYDKLAHPKSATIWFDVNNIYGSDIFTIIQHDNNEDWSERYPGDSLETSDYYYGYYNDTNISYFEVTDTSNYNISLDSDDIESEDVLDTRFDYGITGFVWRNSLDYKNRDINSGIGFQVSSENTMKLWVTYNPGEADERLHKMPVATMTLSSPSSGTFTFRGLGGETAWCNSSGDAYETGTIAITAETNNGYNSINFTVNDMEYGGTYLGAGNISLYCSVDQSTWRNFGSFTDGGSTINVNANTWTWADDPFTGMIDTYQAIESDDTLYFRFKLEIPATIDGGIYINTGCRITGYRIERY